MISDTSSMVGGETVIERGDGRFAGVSSFISNTPYLSADILIDYATRNGLGDDVTRWACETSCIVFVILE
jgi:hypothetical protein